MSPGEYFASERVRWRGGGWEVKSYLAQIALRYSHLCHKSYLDLQIIYLPGRVRQIEATLAPRQDLSTLVSSRASSNQSDYVNTFLSRFCQLIGQIGTCSPDKLTPASITSSPTSTTFINQNRGKITKHWTFQNQLDTFFYLENLNAIDLLCFMFFWH